MREFAGYIAAFLLGLCALPLLDKTIRDGHARGVSLPFLLMWWGGEALMLTYVWPTNATPLLINYALNVGMVGVVLAYRLIFGGE